MLLTFNVGTKRWETEMLANYILVLVNKFTWVVRRESRVREGRGLKRTRIIGYG